MDGAATIGAAAIMALDAVEFRAQRPRPRQGGHRITAQYLQELPETEALWAFRCVYHMFRFFGLTTDGAQFQNDWSQSPPPHRYPQLTE